MGEVVALFVKVLMPFLYGLCGSLAGLLFIWPSARNTFNKVNGTLKSTGPTDEMFLTVRPTEALQSFGSWAGWGSLVDVSQKIGGWFDEPARFTVFQTVGVIGASLGCSVLVFMWASSSMYWTGAPGTTTWISLAILAEVSQPAWPIVLIGFGIIVALLIGLAIVGRWIYEVWGLARTLMQVGLDLGLALTMGFIRLFVFAYM